MSGVWRRLRKQAPQPFHGDVGRQSSGAEPSTGADSVKIVFASANEHKVGEINAITSAFAALGDDVKNIANVKFVLPQEGFDPVENGETFIENAKIKAVAAALIEKGGRKIFLADDSGLCVDALNGEPGLKSARYAPTNDERIKKVLKNLEGNDARCAHFICAMVLCDEAGQILHTTEGICRGKIALKPQGEGGFGYDPIFIPEGYDCTIAQLSDEEKNEISHRGKALREMLDWLTLSISHLAVQ